MKVSVITFHTDFIRRDRCTLNTNVVFLYGISTFNGDCTCNSKFNFYISTSLQYGVNFIHLYSEAIIDSLMCTGKQILRYCSHKQCL